MIQTLRNFTHDETGTTVIEYGLIAALLSVAAIASMQAVGGSVDLLFNKVRGVLTAAA